MLRILIAAVVYLLLDAIWLMGVAKGIYTREIGSVMRVSGGSLNPNIPAVVFVYLILIGGLLLFVLPKADGNAWHALGWGALFGLVVYGTYDFTNLAILSQWTLKISIIDVLWGMFVCGVTSFVTVLLTR
jgi:uncharacterized membrane protein